MAVANPTANTIGRTATAAALAGAGAGARTPQAGAGDGGGDFLWWCARGSPATAEHRIAAMNTKAKKVVEEEEEAIIIMIMISIN